MHSTIKRFFSMPGDRLNTRRADMNLLGLGLALAALVFGYTVPDSPGPFDAGLLLIFTFASGYFSIVGALAKVPTAEIDERWDDRYDELRDQTEAVLSVLSSGFIGTVWMKQVAEGQQRFENWQDMTARVPIPVPDERPLHEWNHFLSTHESVYVREFLRFAQSVNGIVQVSNFRRYAVRTYHRFGRLLRADASGFKAWFEDEGVKDGAQPLVVILAYLEVVRATANPTEFRGDGHSGFWYLAERWHPQTIRLPRPTPRPQT